MFDKRKYTMRFQKSYISVDWGKGRVVTDNHLMECLLTLQHKYEFEIICTKFNNCFYDSKIKIKCNKKDKQKIFADYVMILGHYIEKVRF